MSSAVLERPPDVAYWEPANVETVDVRSRGHDVQEVGGDPTIAAAKEQIRSLTLRAQFDRLADALAADAAGVSAVRRLVRHPAYGGILLLGADAVPYLIERVERGEQRAVWLKLLGSLTNLPPSAGQETIDDSATAWISWARAELPRG